MHPSTTNPYNFGLIVSTNYINPNGFDDTFRILRATITTSSIGSGGSLCQSVLTKLANLFYSPRAPVFVPNEFFLRHRDSLHDRSISVSIST
jgi:hypothetical protein